MWGGRGAYAYLDMLYLRISGEGNEVVGYTCVEVRGEFGLGI